MILQFDGFDWDRGNRAKCQKHGLSIALIESLFAGPLPSFQAPLIRKRNAAFARWDKLATAGEYSLCSRCGARAIRTGAISN